MTLSDPIPTRLETLSGSEPWCASLFHLTVVTLILPQSDSIKLYTKAHGAKVDLPFQMYSRLFNSGADDEPYHKS